MKGKDISCRLRWWKKLLLNLLDARQPTMWSQVFIRKPTLQPPILTIFFSNGTTATSIIGGFPLEVRVARILKADEDRSCLTIKTLLCKMERMMTSLLQPQQRELCWFVSPKAKMMCQRLFSIPTLAKKIKLLKARTKMETHRVKLWHMATKFMPREICRGQACRQISFYRLKKSTRKNSITLHKQLVHRQK